MAIVVTVHEYGGTAEEAERELRDANAHYETPHFVYAADKMDDLPHPVQVEEIANHFANRGLY